MDKFSPKAIRDQLVDIEDRFLARISQGQTNKSHFIITIFLLIILLGSAVLVKKIDVQGKASFISLFHAIVQITLLTVIAGFLIRTFKLGLAKIALMGAVITPVSLAFTVHSLNLTFLQKSVSVGFFGFLPVYFFLLLKICHWLPTRYQLVSLFCGFLAISGGAYFLLSSDYALGLNAGHYITRWLMPGILAVAMFRVLKGRFNSDDLKLKFLLPGLIFYPLPIPALADQFKESDNKIRFQGALNIFRACLAGFALLCSLRVFEAVNGLVLDSLISYFNLFLRSYFSITLIVGGIQWLGFSIQNPFDYPLLAVSPYERWRRWNTYFYNWFFSLVFVPLARRTGALFFSVILVFVVTFFFHIKMDYISWFLEPGKIPVVNLSVLLFFILHGVAVYLSLLLKSVWPPEGTLSGWTGVFVTWVMMTFIHGIWSFGY